MPAVEEFMLTVKVERSGDPWKLPAPLQVPLTTCPDVVTFPEVAGIVAANCVPFAKKPLIVI